MGFRAFIPLATAGFLSLSPSFSLVPLHALRRPSSALHCATNTLAVPLSPLFSHRAPLFLSFSYLLPSFFPLSVPLSFCLSILPSSSFPSFLSSFFLPFYPSLFSSLIVSFPHSCPLSSPDPPLLPLSFYLSLIPSPSFSLFRFLRVPPVHLLPYSKRPQRLLVVCKRVRARERRRRR